MSMVLDASALTPPQRRAYDELLAVDERRPPADRGLVDRIRGLLEERTLAVAAARPPGRRGCG
jgi:hypothetical protein